MIVLASFGCHESGSIEATRFTVAAHGTKCVVIADLVSTRDSSNVDLDIKACAASTCSASSHTGVADGPFVPGRAKTSVFEVENCPPKPDRVVVEVSRWGSANAIVPPRATVDHVAKTPSDGGSCNVAATVHVAQPAAASSVILVARDAETRPLDRSRALIAIPSGAAQPVTETFRVPCERIAAVDAEVIQ